MPISKAKVNKLKMIRVGGVRRSRANFKRKQNRLMTVAQAAGSARR